MTKRPPFRRALALTIPALLLSSAGCDDGPTDNGGVETVRIGALLEVTGPIPEVGESSRRAAVLYLEELEDRGGVQVGGERVDLEVLVRDSETDSDVATSAARGLIDDDDVLALLGPNTSSLAIVAGGVAEAEATPLISPWSTNPATTEGREWVFRVPFTDSYQGPVLAEFATAQYSSAERACVLFESDEAYSRGIAESFASAWTGLHGAGSVVAEESFPHHETDIDEQLERLRDADCDLLFAPLYADDVVHAIPGARAVGIDAPILGSDSWVGAGLIEGCGDACEGVYISAHFIPTGATGTAGAFVDLYQDRWGAVPDDVAALTWDALQVIERGLENCGVLTDHLEDDRACLRDGMAAVDDVAGVTGAIAYDGSGDPEKCVVIGRIQGGALSAVDEFCPAV